MKLEKRLTGLFASLAFLIVGFGGYVHTLNAIQSVLYGLAASIILGVIGYQIGYIVTHPSGKRRKSKSPGLLSSLVSAAKTPAGTSTPMTGEETLIDEISS